MRLEEAMRAVKIDFTTSLNALGSGEAVTLQSLLEGRKAMLLQFWSPASRECEASLPDYIITAKALAAHGIAMVSVLPENSEKITADAKAMLLPLSVDPPGAWLIDSKEKPLAHELRVQSLPAFILISNQGTILFNGDPTDEGLWDALTKLDPKIIRPQSQLDTE
jgi:hypothetical protein